MKNHETWRLLDSESENPFLNLAIEEAIAKMVGTGATPNTVRFWRNKNAVVLGYSQSAESEVNFEACRKYGTAVARRLTGGGAVYHDLGNLNFSIYVLKSHRLIANDLSETFRTLASAAVESLKTLDLHVVHEPLNTLQVNDQKICGAAGSISSGFVLYHGSILVDSDLTQLSKILDTGAGDFKKKGVHSNKKDVTNVSTLLGRHLSIQEMKTVLKNGFETTFSVRLETGMLTREEEILARQLLREKYSIDAWIFKR